MFLTKRALLLSLLGGAASTALPRMAAAQSGDEFYRGKTIKVIVPTGPGGTYALYGNIANERLNHHIPGGPSLIMQYMPSGIQAMNYLYNVPDKDGLTIGMISQSAGIVQVLSPEHVKYDLRKFAALGLFSQLNAVLTVSEKKTPAKTVDDLKKMDVTLGATDTSSYQYIIPQVMNRYLGTRLKVITGYKGIAETTLAMDRGEVDGVFTSWLAIKEQRGKAALQNDPGRIILQVGYNSEPDLDAPLLQDLAPDEKARQAFAFIASFSALSRCLVAPPGMPDGAARAAAQGRRRHQCRSAIQGGAGTEEPAVPAAVLGDPAADHGPGRRHAARAGGVARRGAEKACLLSEMNDRAAPLLESNRGARARGLGEVEVNMAVCRKLVHHKLCTFSVAARRVTVGDHIRITEINQAVRVETGARSPGVVDIVRQLRILIEGDALPRIGRIRRW